MTQQKSEEEKASGHQAAPPPSLLLAPNSSSAQSSAKTTPQCTRWRAEHPGHPAFLEMAFYLYPISHGNTPLCSFLSFCISYFDCTACPSVCIPGQVNKMLWNLARGARRSGCSHKEDLRGYLAGKSTQAQSLGHLISRRREERTTSRKDRREKVGPEAAA